VVSYRYTDNVLTRIYSSSSIGVSADEIGFKDLAKPHLEKNGMYNKERNGKPKFTWGES
jgi:hypothetical protein